MGAEAVAKRRVGRRWVPGKLLLETDDVQFRGDARCRILLKDVKGAAGTGTTLTISTSDEEFVFQIEADASVWAKKILHPKTRAEKLGVKSSQRYRLEGLADPAFRKELEGAGARASTTATVDHFFVAASSREDLAAFPRWAKEINKDGSVWVVYPKGKKELTENDVLQAGRDAGLKDVKVVRFSQTHTTLKFVWPVSKR